MRALCIDWFKIGKFTLTYEVCSSFQSSKFTLYGKDIQTYIRTYVHAVSSMCT